MHADLPIEGRHEDRLGRGALAERLARSVRKAPAHVAFVVAVTGASATGRTSVLVRSSVPTTKEALEAALRDGA